MADDLFDPSYYSMYIDRLEAPDVRVIVSLSSGNASAVAGELALKAYGYDRVDLVFADTLIEDDDNYRFLKELEARWGKSIIRYTDGRDPYEVAEGEGIIPNDMLATCSYELKIKLVQDHVKHLQDDGAVVIVALGFDHKDAKPRPKKPQGRLPDPRKRWAARNALVWYPLLEKAYCNFTCMVKLNYRLFLMLRRLLHRGVFSPRSCTNRGTVTQIVAGYVLNRGYAIGGAH